MHSSKKIRRGVLEGDSLEGNLDKLTSLNPDDWFKGLLINA